MIILRMEKTMTLVEILTIFNPVSIIQTVIIWWGITQMIKSNEDRAAGAREASRQADQRHQEASRQADQRHQEASRQADQRHREASRQADQRHREAMAKHEETMERMEKQHHETMEQLRQQGAALETLIERTGKGASKEHL